jgi:hypothetical protein
MATPRYDEIVAKVRDWSNKPEANTIPNSVIQDCLRYSADECYRLLRIPPLEESVQYTISATDNAGEASLGSPFGSAYSSFSIPEDLTQFIYLRTVAQSTSEATSSAFPSNLSRVFNEVTDKRTFFDSYAEKYSSYNWMWQEDKIFVHPQLAVGSIVEIHYYKRLPALDAVYNVSPINYTLGLSDALQPYLTLVTSGGTDLFFSTADSIENVFATLSEATLYNATVTTKMYTGNETDNWLRDQNERMVIWGSLYNLGAYLFDDKMEQRYQAKFMENINSINKEEKFRRAAGGNVQMNFNTNGLI